MNHQRCNFVISMLWNLQIRIFVFLPLSCFYLIKYNADKRNGSSDGESTPGYEGGAIEQQIPIKSHVRIFLEDEK